MKREQVINLVKIKLDESSQFDKSEPLIAESNNKDINPIESYINENLDKAIDDVKLILPLHVFSDDRILVDGLSTTTLAIDSDYVGTFDLSSDYLRLHTIMLKSWERPVNIALPMESIDYAQQLNKYTRGGTVKPVVVKRGNELALFSCSSEDTTDNEITIYKYIGVTPRGTGYIPDKLVEAVVLRCAGKIANIFNETGQKVTQFEEELKLLISTL